MSKKGRKQIQGLTYIADFISEQEEKDLLDAIKASDWRTKLKRRTQHYGYYYDYTQKDATKEAPPIPGWCKFVITRLIENDHISEEPDQVIINEYKPGQGIAPHIDRPSAFSKEIVSLSLGSDIIMDFARMNDSQEIKLLRRSVVILKGDARYRWTHGIASRHADYGVYRKTRISLTFRKKK